MKSIFDKDAYNEVTDRVKALQKDSKGQWGSMSAGQMLWHCQVPIRLVIKNKKYPKKGNPLIRILFKKSMYNDTLWRKNLPTIPLAKATEEKDFIVEKESLLKLLPELYALREREEWNPHPVFGEFTARQWGQFQYKHLDHHLRQFNV